MKKVWAREGGGSGLPGLLALAGVAAAQVALDVRPARSKAEPRPRTSIRVDSNLVLAPVSVCDSRNRPVTGLEKENFRIFDNGVEQTVTHFSMDDEPLAAGLVFDVSASMASKMKRARTAAAAFFETAGPEDEFFLVEFNDRPRLAVPLSARPGAIMDRLSQTRARGKTALIDAVLLAMDEIGKSGKGRKALLVVSDGGDNSSRFSESRLRSVVRERDVIVYTIGIFEPVLARVRTAEEMDGPALLSEIAVQTGGRHYPVRNLKELPGIAERIGIELRNRYVLGFTPADPSRDGRYHRLNVKLSPPPGLPPLRAFWRLGYYAPSE